MSTILKASTADGGRAATFAFDKLGEGARHTAPILAAPQEQQRAEADRQLIAFRAAIDAIDAARAGWLAHWERAALGVATAIAARVIRREIERTPAITLTLVKEALELAAGSADVELHMNPDDLAALGADVERLAVELGRAGDAKIVADPAVTQGGCRVETRLGTIDQQVEAQLARIERELT